MLKRAIRGAVRRAQDWLAAGERAPEINYGTPPFAYDKANGFFMQSVVERGLRRPHYAWGALQALNLAKSIGLKRISFIEFGVAGGNGLTALESIAAHLSPSFGVEVEIHGFDAVEGMPPPKDYRDLPHVWQPGFYRMDKEKLERRLTNTTLHLGPVAETVSEFIRQKPAPVGFIVFDLCIYSSTAQALQLFAADPSVLAPRIYCFFRNTMGPTLGDFNGERLAMSEFNTAHDLRKVSKIYGLQYFLRKITARWVDQYFMAHVFDHPLYGHYDYLIQEAQLDLPG